LYSRAEIQELYKQTDRGDTYDCRSYKGDNEDNEDDTLYLQLPQLSLLGQQS
jgi:hypothetical protein